MVPWAVCQRLTSAALTGGAFPPDCSRGKSVTRVQLFCQDESVTSWKAKTGQEHKPLTLLLDDRADEDPLKEKVELRIEDDEEKLKWTGKVKGRVLTVAIYRMNKFNGIARVEGRVIAATGGK